MTPWRSGERREDQGVFSEGMRSRSAWSWEEFAGWKAFMAPYHTHRFAEGVLHTH